MKKQDEYNSMAAFVASKPKYLNVTLFILALYSIAVFIHIGMKEFKLEVDYEVEEVKDEEGLVATVLMDEVNMNYLKRHKYKSIYKINNKSIPVKLRLTKSNNSDYPTASFSIPNSVVARTDIDQKNFGELHITIHVDNILSLIYKGI